MLNETQASMSSERSLDELLAQYIASEEVGQPLDRPELLARYPQFAGELREFFANRDQMQRLAEPLRGNDAPTRARAPLGTVRYFGDYELLEEVAAGGMGIVYKARQLSLNRIVAVKMILKGTLATEADIQRFRAEAEAAGNLQHPAIVAIHEVGLHEGQHYFSMNFVDGHSLAELPRDQPLSARQAAEYLRDAAEAVHYAHQQGTLHRDLKPSNILIDRQGRVRITDFGLAKKISGDSDLTLTGQILGTPSYMPPEQALGKRSLIGAASDIYSLGAVLYELLTGRPPFRGESPVETLKQVESLDPVSPRLLSPATPRDLETICLKCLEKEPHKRYGTAQLLADDLGRYLRHEPIVARPISRPARVWRWCRRKPAVAALSITIVLLLVTVATVSTVASLYLKGQNDIVLRQKGALELQSQQINRESERAHSAEQAANERLFQSLVNHARASRWSRRAGQRMEGLKAISEAAELGRQLKLDDTAVQTLRDEYVACLSLVDLQVEREWEIPHAEWHTAFDHSLERFATWNKKNGISICRTRDGAELLVLPPQSGRPGYREFSPDGRWLAAWYVGGAFVLWDASTGEKAVVQRNVLESFTFRHDSGALVLSMANGKMEVHAAPQWETPRTLHVQNGQSAALHPDGVHVAVATDKTIEIWRVDGTQPLQRVTTSVRPSGMLAWDPDGRILAVPCFDYSIDIREFSSLRQRAVLRGHNNQGIEVFFSHDGALLASRGWDGTTRLWNPLIGRELLRIDGLVRGFRFDDRQIAYSDGRSRVGIWNLSGNRERRSLGAFSEHSHTLVTSCVAINRAGDLLAASGGRGVMLWQLPSTRFLGLLVDGPQRGSVQFDWEDRVVLPSGADLQTIELARSVDGNPTLNKVTETTLAKFAAPITAVAVSEDGKHAIARDGASSAAVLSLVDANPCCESLTHPQIHRKPTGIALSPNGQFAATMTWGGHGLKVWGVQDGRLIGDLWPEAYTGCVAFSPDGRWLAASVGQELRTWEVTGWKPLGRTPRTGAGDLPGPIAYSPDGCLLVAAMSRSGVQLLDPATSRLLATIDPPDVSYEIVSIAFRGDSNLVAIGYSDSVDLWDLRLVRDQLRGVRLDWQSPAPTSTLAIAARTESRTALINNNDVPRPGTSDSAMDLAANAQARPTTAVPVATATSPNSSAEPRVAVVPQQLAVDTALRWAAPTDTSKRKYALAYATAGDRLATRGKENVNVWSANDGNLLTKFPIRSNLEFSAFAYSPDGRLLAGAADDGVHLYDLEFDEELDVLTVGEKNNGSFHRVVFSPDGKWLAAGHRQGANVWETKQWQRVHAIETGTTWVGAVDFSRDSSLLAMGGFDRHVRTWSVPQWKLVHDRIGPAAVYTVAFSPDNVTLGVAFATDRIGQFMFWNVKELNRFQAAGAHSKIAHTIAFRPDGRRIVTSGDDGTIALWDAATRRPIGKIQLDVNSAYCAEFSPDGKSLATVGSEPVIRVWDAERLERLADQYRLDGAIAEYREAIHIKPANANTLVKLGVALYEKKLFDEAAATFRQAIAAKPDYFLAHDWLGFVLLVRGDTDSSIPCFQEALRLNPMSAKAHTNLGNALGKKGDRDGAIAAYRKALDVAPGFAGAEANLKAILAGTRSTDAKPPDTKRSGKD